MYKKAFLALSSVLLLSACGTENTETEETEVEPEQTENTQPEDTDVDQAVEETAEPEETGETNASESAQTDAPVHVFDNLVDETTFTNDYGLQSWDDYKILTDGFSLGEITIMNQESRDLATIEATNKSEIDERFASMDVREDVFLNENQLSDFEQMIHYRYPPETDSEYAEIADFFSEISLYYVDDNLMFSAITPGLYEVELNNLPDAETLATFLTVSEIEEINPRVYTVAQMTINGNNIKQVMVPANGVDQEGNEHVMAFYFFIHGEDILQYAYLPFQMVAQDFPTNSVILYQQVMSELETL
jgi:hypothetical protein